MGPFPLQAVVTDRDDSIRNATKAVWPEAYQLLCTWHILENLRKKVTPPFRELYGRQKTIDDQPVWQVEVAKFESEWQRLVIDATTETSLTDGLRCLRSSYSELHYRGLLEDALIEAENIVATCRSHICRVYTDRIRHLGQRTNSRLEGMHSVLKNSIGSRAARRKASLVDAASGVLQHMEEQWDNVMERQAKQANSTFTHHSIFQPLLHAVSDYALERMQPQLGRALNAADGAELPPCTNMFTTAMGLPCAHHLKTVLDNETCVRLTDIFGHWWLNTREEMEQYRDLLNDQLADETLEHPAEFDFERLRAESKFVLDPVRVGRRKAAAAEASARARRLGETSEEPETLDTGRIPTQTECAAGMRHPQWPLCDSCGARHSPSHVCADRRMENFTLSQPSTQMSHTQMSQMSGVTTTQTSQTPSARPSDEQLKTPVVRCFFCSNPHRRKGCKALAEWRKGRILELKRLEVLEQQRNWRGGSQERSSDEDESETDDSDNEDLSTSTSTIDLDRFRVESSPSSHLRHLEMSGPVC